MNNKINNSRKKNRHKATRILILCLFSLYIYAHVWAAQGVSVNINYTESSLQSQKATQQQRPTTTGPKLIVLKKANIMEKRLGMDAQILIDSVVLYHNGAYMYCDSAYLNEAQNTFEAFGTVRVNQGDTLFLYSNYLEYDGNIQLLKARENVRLENRDVTLFTDNLDFDRVANIGYYFDGGILVDSLNELRSFWGQYEPNKHFSLFSDSVKLTNPNFVMFTDTLTYDTQTKIATILGPTRIESDSVTIYSTKGWYNTQTEQSLLLDQSRVINKKGNRILIGDSISYHKKEGYGEVFGHMFLQDTIQKIILIGNYGLYNERTEYSMATDSAYVIEYSQPDSLFLHADTLQLQKDSTFRLLKAYHGVRFYRSDIQGVSDSLQFNSRDSILHLYKDPILWNGNNQISGDTINIHFNDSTIEMAHVKKYAFSIEQKLDSIHFNQLKGRDLKAYFKGKDVKRVLVEGNAESIFYPEEDDLTIIGMNQTESSYLSIDFKDKKIDKLKLWPKVTGSLTPLPDLRPDQGKLTDFFWFDYLRPINKDDIFRKIKKRSVDTPKRSDKFNRDLN